MSKPFISWLVQRLWVDHPVLSTCGGRGGSGEVEDLLLESVGGQFWSSGQQRGQA